MHTFRSLHLAESECSQFDESKKLEKPENLKLNICNCLVLSH